MKNPKKFLDQQQSQPGKEHKMVPKPELIRKNYTGSGKLKNKVAMVTGGDSGIGASVVLHFAKEGADIVLVYLNETKDANDIKEQVEKLGRKCFLIETDLKDEKNCISCVETCIKEYGKLNIVVNNAAMQFPQDSLLDINTKQLHKTFETNIYPYFYLTKAALKHLNSE